MERVLTLEKLVKLHLLQALERKKALLANLELPEDETTDSGAGCLLSAQERKRYQIGETIHRIDGIFRKQFDLSFYFRGENSYYIERKSSWARNLPKEFQDRCVYKIVEQMRQCEFETALKQLQKMEPRNPYTVFPGIVAENYGISSDWVSFTSNFDEALFYACCVYDEICGDWRPLNRNDFIRRGSDMMHGVIYMASSINPELRFREETGAGSGVMTPAGEQPFLRNNPQYAYALRLRETEDLAKDPCFDRLVFAHSEEFCADVYQRMEGGKFLYSDGRNRFLEQKASHIRQQKRFSESVFLEAMKCLEQDPDIRVVTAWKIDIKNWLRQQGVTFFGGGSAKNGKRIPEKIED